MQEAGCNAGTVHFFRTERFHVYMHSDGAARVECRLVADSKRASWCNASATLNGADGLEGRRS